MDPFRAGPPTCAACGAQNPDHFSADGEQVCRACAELPSATARLAKGRTEGRTGAKIGLFAGALLIFLTLFWGLPELSRGDVFGRSTARLVGLGLGLGVVVIAVSYRNYRTFSPPKR